MGFSRLQWGFLFFIDFRLQGFDVLPDIVGYILLYVGLSELSARNAHFGKARGYCLPLIIIGFFDLLPLSVFGSGMNSVFGSIMQIAAAVISIGLVYHICWGISALARESQDPVLESLAVRRFNYFLWVQMADPVLIILALIIPGFATVVLLPFVILSFIVIFLLMGLMQKAQQAFPMD